MFYFGWRRSAVQAAQDYVRRSITSLYPLLLVTAALALAWLWPHRKVVRTVLGWEPARRQRSGGGSARPQW